MLQELQAEAATAVLHNTSFLVSLRQMFRSLRRHLLNLRLFLYRSEFTGFYMFFVYGQKRKFGEVKYLCCVSLKAHWEEAVSLVSANTHRCRNISKILQFMKTCCMNPCTKVTSFSTSSSLTKLSGKTPCLPPISPIHQPASAQSWMTHSKVLVLMAANSVLLKVGLEKCLYLHKQT